MIIKSILETDLYKFTMQLAVIEHFPHLKVKYKFTDRNKISFPDGFDIALKEEVKRMETLILTIKEKDFLSRKCGSYLTPTYIDFLAGYRFDSSELSIHLDENNKLKIEIEGYWYRTILWEVPLMALISELYFKMTGQIVDIYNEEIIKNDISKATKLVEHNAHFADFGTRRRYSAENQEKIVTLFITHGGKNFVGTSNVYLAYKYDINVIGSIAHEFIMVHAALYGYKMANSKSLENWVESYGGNLGIALSDTYTTEIFLKSFDMKMSKLFDGLRNDSGSPFKFVDNVVEHYKKMGIDPMSKSIIFSDGLDVDLACQIKEYCVGKIKSSFGIGTNFTNDVGVKPLNIVIKISEVLINDEWVDAVKISDNIGKNTGNTEEVTLCKKILKIY